ncbi:MAG: hypothetical protein AAF604_08585 [Acidobacteriota bacterium]
MKLHPNRTTLGSLLDRIESKLQRQCLKHLLDCERCRGEMKRLIDQEDGPLARVIAWPTASYQGILDRVVERAQQAGLSLSREEAEAPVLLAELLLQPAAERRRSIEQDPRLRSWPLAELLLDRSRARSFDDPVRAEILARLGLQVIEVLEGDSQELALKEDLRARGLAYLANSLRMRSDLEAAEALLVQADEALRFGTGDPLEKARILELTATLRKDQRRFDEATHLLQRAIRRYRSADETHRAGRALISKASLHRAIGAPEKATEVLREAVEYLDAAREPRLRLCARHNLADYLSDLEKHLEARAVLREARPLYEQFPDAWTQRRRLWVEGKILRGLGQLDEAEGRLLEARRGFLDQEIVYDAALVSLDLASIYAQQGREADLRRLAREMLPIFQDRQIHREARIALSYFRQAAEVDLVSPQLVRRVHLYLRQSRDNPELRFEQ